MIPCEWITEAENRIAPHIKKTPLTYDDELDLYIKWENHQETGSFKVRGAVNKVLLLQPWEREAGLVAASAGNHGAGVAIAAKTVNAGATIFVSENADPSKITAMRQLGADVRMVPGGYGEAESAALLYSESSGATWISPYNDGQIIAGQATLGKEIFLGLPDQLAPTWIVPVGGGGLLAGLSCSIHCSCMYPRSKRPIEYDRPKLVGVQSEASPFFHAIYYQGTDAGVVEQPSLADGLAGKIESNSITIPISRRYLDKIILVNESEIADAISFTWERYQERIEGAAATVMAAVITNKCQERPAVAIITGGNIQPELHASLCKDSGVK